MQHVHLAWSGMKKHVRAPEGHQRGQPEPKLNVTATSQTSTSVLPVEHLLMFFCEKKDRSRARCLVSYRLVVQRMSYPGNSNLDCIEASFTYT